MMRYSILTSSSVSASFSKYIMFNTFCNKHSILSYPARSYIPFKQWYAGVIGIHPLLLDSPLHSFTVFSSMVDRPSSCEIIFSWALKLTRNLLENWKDNIYCLHYYQTQKRQAELLSIVLLYSVCCP